MRFALLALLLPAFVVAGGAGNDGEKLFQDLEKKVGKAKAVRVAFAGKIMKGAKEAGHFKGVVELAEADKGRIEVEGSAEGKDIVLKMVSDGKTMKVMATPPGGEKEEPLPKHFGAMVRTGLSRVGPIAGLLLAHPRVEGKEEPELDKVLRVSDFKLGENAKVEGREARVIAYKVTLASNDKVSAKLWIDAKTHLPLKRELSANKEGETIRIVETYSEFNVGPKGEVKSPAPPK
jgi:outer membrane lipoprotein-sorting protein